MFFVIRSFGLNVHSPLFLYSQAYIDPTSTLHRLTSTPHRPHIDPTSTLHRPYIYPTSTQHRPLSSSSYLPYPYLYLPYPYPYLSYPYLLIFIFLSSSSSSLSFYLPYLYLRISYSILGYYTISQDIIQYLRISYNILGYQYLRNIYEKTFMLESKMTM